MPNDHSSVSNDVAYVILLFVLFVVPRFLQRYRLPSAITSLALGAVAVAAGWFQADATIGLLATFGIVALFLFAGLDVDLEELRPDLPILAQHLVLWSVTLLGISTLLAWLFQLTPRSAALLGLALVTPSAGFILDSLNVFGLSDSEKRWTKSKAITSELLALMVMFVTLQSETLKQLALSTGLLVALIVVLPSLFRWFASRIAPYAPRSEFAFLLMVAVVCASATRRLGVYYLVGAFVVGIAARQFRTRLPAMSSERMLGAVEAFASFFVPFYFFKAGLGVTREELDIPALLFALGLLVGGTALRLGEIALHRWLTLREPPRTSLRVGVALLPTLVFTLVIADILRTRRDVPASLIGAMVLYAVVITLLPGLLLRLPTVDYALPMFGPLPAPDAVAAAGLAGASDPRTDGDVASPPPPPPPPPSPPASGAPASIRP